MSDLQVYSRRGCHLCEILIEELLPLVRGSMHVDVRDVDSNDEWLQRYGEHVPVVEYEGRMLCRYTLDRSAIDALRQELGAKDEGTSPANGA